MTNLEESGRRLSLKGKYIHPIENYVQTLNLDEEFPFEYNDEYRALEDMIVALHKDYLTSANAMYVVFSELTAFTSTRIDYTTALTENQKIWLRSELVQHLKGAIESYPRAYTLRLELPCFPIWGEYRIVISDAITLSAGKHELIPDSGTPVTRLASLLRDNGSEKSSTCIEIKATGFASTSPEDPAISECISWAKQCVFLLSSYGYVKPGYTHTDKAKATITTDLYDLTAKVDLPDSVSRCLSTLLLNEKKLEVFDKPEGRTTVASALGIGKMRQANTAEEKNLGLTDCLAQLKRYFSYSSYSDFPSIAAAIEWYQDSKFADNQTFSYLAACIGLEALLGSSEHMDTMSKRLADRYAFLLGKSRADREQLSAEYRDLLDLRGKIVHAKRARLSSDSQASLHKIQTMLYQAIWHEINLMYKNKAPTEA